MPVFGFNTDIKVGNTVFHVQTEDRGVNNPVLDTTIYMKGRVLAKRGTSYQDFLASPDFNEVELHAMLEQQHRRIIEEIRSGQLPEMAQLGALPAPGGISIQLLNPATFLKGSTMTLELQVTRRRGSQPLPGAQVRTLVHTGRPQPLDFNGKTDGDGKLVLQFPRPHMGPGGAELHIQANSPEGQDEIKYTLRARPKVG